MKASANFNWSPETRKRKIWCSGFIFMLSLLCDLMDRSPRLWDLAQKLSVIKMFLKSYVVIWALPLFHVTSLLVDYNYVKKKKLLNIIGPMVVTHGMSLMDWSDVDYYAQSRTFTFGSTSLKCFTDNENISWFLFACLLPVFAQFCMHVLSPLCCWWEKTTWGNHSPLLHKLN